MQTFDELTIISDANLGRLAILERLCDLMAANYDSKNQVYFGEVREEAFWRGLQALAHDAAEATEDMRTLTSDLYDAVPSGGAK